MIAVSRGQIAAEDQRGDEGGDKREHESLDHPAQEALVRVVDAVHRAGVEARSRRRNFFGDVL